MRKALALFLVASTFAFSQTTSTISGVVVDSAGEGLPGVVVTASSPAMQGDRTSVSGVNGRFLFRLIPPGDYKLTATMDGMQTSVTDVALGLGQTANPKLTMKPAATEETMVVTATADPVLSTTAVTSHFKDDFINNIAGSRDQRSVAILAPGTSNASFNNQISISGAPTHANVYLVNGVDSRFDNLRGGPANLVIEDAIQETTIMTSAISAEYGHFGGGVINSITKSGGNDFEGSFRSAFTNADWTNLTPFEKENDDENVDRVNTAYTLTLGGPIIKDRLWFFGSFYNLERDLDAAYRTPRQLPDSAAIAYGLAPDQPTPSVGSIDGRSTEDERFEIKLTGRIGENHEVVASYQKKDFADVRNGSRPLTDDALWPVRYIPVEGYSLNYRGTINDSWTVDLLYSERESNFNERPTGHIVGDHREVGTLLRDQRSRGYWNTALFLGKPDEPRSNETLRAKLHYFWASDNMGSHDIVAGFEDFTDSRFANNRQSLNDWQFWSDVRYDGNTPVPIYSNTSDDGRYRSRLVYYPIEVPSLTSDLNAKSVFINDSWNYNDNWAFNIGFRYEDRVGKAQDGNKSVDDAGFSPRLSANYDIFGDGRHGISVSYSRYLQRIGNAADEISDAGSPTFARLDYSGPQTENPNEIIQWLNDRYGDGFFLDPLNHPGRAAWEADLQTNNLYDPAGANTVVGNFGANGVVREPLDSPYTDEYRIGWQWRLDRGYLKTDFVLREFGNFYIAHQNQFTGTTANGLADLTVINNDDSNFERNYHAVQMQGSYRFTDNFGIAGNYTWSQTYGNIDGESSSGVSGTTNITTAYPEWNDFEARNPRGYLPNDQRHIMRLFATYEMSTRFGDFTFVGTERFESGTPYSGIVSLSLTSGRDVLYGLPARSESPYLSTPTTTSYYIGGRNAGRGEDMTQTDLGINWELPLSKARIFLEIDIFNLFDQSAAPYGWDYNTSVSRGPKTFNVYSETPVEGETEHYVLDDDFGKPDSASAYQTPRSFRFDIGIRF